MRVLYGVCGEGMGHATRSAVVARHLMARGHAVDFAVWNDTRAENYLRQKFPLQVTSTPGLGFAMADNAVQPLTTLAMNVAKQIAAFPMGHILAAIQIPKPDVVVSDCDPWVARYAGLTGRPLIAVDNIHFMSRCTHCARVGPSSKEDRQAAALMFATVGKMVPSAKKYLVTTFAEAPIAKGSTELHKPILREEVARIPRTLGSHVVVYFNDKADWNGILGGLSHCAGDFRVYGMPGKYHGFSGFGRVQQMAMSDRGFLEDLASSRAVIGGAGFTLMTEAIYLGKPMLALPFRGQFEQILNANYLSMLGYGERAFDLTANTIAGFLSRSDRYRANLEGLKHDDNRGLLSALDRALAA